MNMMRVAVIGGGASGLAAAYVLAKEGVKVVVYEKENCLGGDLITPLHLTFMTFDRALYVDVLELFECVGVDREISEISYSVSLDEGKGFEWGTGNGLSSLFAQKKNVLNPWFWRMISEITDFKNDAYIYIEEVEKNPDIDRDETLGHFVESHGYTLLFQKAFLIPVCSSIWSCSSSSVVLTFSAYLVLSFLRNRTILELPCFSKRHTPKWNSQSYINRIEEELESRGCQVNTNSEIASVFTTDKGCVVTCKDGLEEAFDGCIIAAHAPDALNILGKHATYHESRILAAFQYAHSDVFLHGDDDLMPKTRGAWSQSNFLETSDGKACTTYWLNNVQSSCEPGIPFLVTLNPPRTPKGTSCKWSASHPMPSVAAARASSQLSSIQGKRGLWFCGAYQGHGFCEDGVKSGIVAANGMLRKHYTCMNNPKCMAPSYLESGARLLVTRFLRRFIVSGCLILFEEGGNIFAFEGSRRKSDLKVTLRVHNPQFYWKVAKEADLGFADAYINGDISFVDANEGLLHFILLIIENTEMNARISKLNKESGWWRELLNASQIGHMKDLFMRTARKNTLFQARRNISMHYNRTSILYMYIHMCVLRVRVRVRDVDMCSGWWRELLNASQIGHMKDLFMRTARKNTLFQARRNISMHYDLSDEMFSLFLDETMTYSCAIFKNPEEDLKNAQLRKLHTLIDKARINKEHRILEIGCGWGSLALEVVKKTGCKYTGITLSQNQLHYIESKVKEEGLQDQIEILLCDYRQLPNNHRYDRIISCGMIEHVGHEYMEDFFKCCESLLAEKGILVLQFIAVADEKYEEYRSRNGFASEYIFHGGCLPSLNKVISSMAAGSRLRLKNVSRRMWRRECVMHLEEIGCHYFHTLRRWRQNFLHNKSKILNLGFDEKFIRTWEYYFDYCAAGFQYCILGDYQMVFTRPGDFAAFGSAPYNPVPSAK